MTPFWAEGPQTQPAPQGAVAALERVRVAFQGEPGAFSEEAIIQLWRGAAIPVPMRSFDDVMHAAETRQVDYGLLPIESTLVGGVDVAYDLLALHEGLWVVAETVIEVHLSLLALHGATIQALSTVSSHPLMLAQCAHFLDRHRHITARPVWDTAGAAREVLESGDPAFAAAAGPLAAERFGLMTLSHRIEDRPDTMMRFLAVAPEPSSVAEGQPVRTALLCVLPNMTGGLLGLIQPLAALGFNVSHFTSRPTREPWHYQFYLEFEHLAHEPNSSLAIDAVKRACSFCRLLGTFARWPLSSNGGAGPGPAIG